MVTQTRQQMTTAEFFELPKHTQKTECTFSSDKLSESSVLITPC